MNDDEAKKFILARRARFIAAAIASVSMACGESSKPTPCLSVMPDNRDGSSEGDAPPQVPPMPCLSPVPTPPPDADVPDAATDISDAGPPPVPCLSVAPKRKDAGAPPQPPPRPCLSPMRPPDKP